MRAFIVDHQFVACCACSNRLLPCDWNYQYDIGTVFSEQQKSLRKSLNCSSEREMDNNKKTTTTRWEWVLDHLFIGWRIQTMCCTKLKKKEEEMTHTARNAVFWQAKKKLDRWIDRRELAKHRGWFWTLKWQAKILFPLFPLDTPIAVHWYYQFLYYQVGLTLCNRKYVWHNLCMTHVCVKYESYSTLWPTTNIYIVHH